MLIPRWDGTDREGTLFKEYLDKLNRYGLFETYDIAKAFLDFYLSFDWTETGEYEIAEVFIKINEQEKEDNNCIKGCMDHSGLQALMHRAIPLFPAIIITLWRTSKIRTCGVCRCYT